MPLVVAVWLLTATAASTISLSNEYRSSELIGKRLYALSVRRTSSAAIRRKDIGIASQIRETYWLKYKLDIIPKITKKAEEKLKAPEPQLTKKVITEDSTFFDETRMD